MDSLAKSLLIRQKVLGPSHAEGNFIIKFVIKKN